MLYFISGTLECTLGWGMSTTTGSQDPSESASESESESGSAERLSYDECFDLLSNHRRRYVLHYLRQEGGPVTLSDLSEQIAAWENETEVEGLSYDQRKRVYTSLQQVHLPRMDDLDVVEFDDREGTVRDGPSAENLDIYLEVVDQWDIPWSYFYLGLGTVNAGIIGAFAVGLWPVATLPEIGLAVFVVTSFLVTSLAHLYVTRTEMRLGGSEEPPSVE